MYDLVFIPRRDLELKSPMMCQSHVYATNERVNRTRGNHFLPRYIAYIYETYLCKITARRHRLALRKLLIEEYEFLTLETASPFRHVRKPFCL